MKKAFRPVPASAIFPAHGRAETAATRTPQPTREWMDSLPRGQIVAMGGGGFLMEPDNPLLDDYVLGLCRRAVPRVCFLPTAAGDALAHLERFFDLFPPERCEADYLSLFSRKVEDLEGFLSDFDVVYVGGGNTVNLLAVWRAQGLADVLPRVMANGTILCGVSAGALCWFARGITDSYGPRLSPLMNGLGFLPGAFCPHYDSDPRRPDAFRAFVREHGEPALSAEDGVGLHFVDGALARCVSSRPFAVARRFTREADGTVAEEILRPVYLGG